MKLHEIIVHPGEEVMETAEQALGKLDIRQGAIVSIIGAVDECCISNMPVKNAKEDLLHKYKEPLEMSGTGEIKDGKPHIHCVLSRENDAAIGGHLHWAKVETWFVKLFVLATP